MRRPPFLQPRVACPPVPLSLVTPCLLSPRQGGKVLAAQKSHTPLRHSSIYLSFYHRFSSWLLSPVLFSVLPYSLGNSNPLRTPHRPAFLHSKLLPHSYAVFYLSQPPAPFKPPSLASFTCVALTLLLRGFQPFSCRRLVLVCLYIVSGHLPHPQAASPTLKYKLLWALVVSFLFAPWASVAPPGGWSPLQSPLVPTAPSFCLGFPPLSLLFPNYSNKASTWNTGCVKASVCKLALH